MCLYPRLIKNRKYTINKKNGGNIPQINDNRVLLVPVGCGNCIECRKQKARGWQIRMLEEIKHNTNGKFVTLTLSNKSIIKLKSEIKGLTGYDLDNKIATIAVRRFLERWRKKYKISVRHWLVTELGHRGTENIHLHGIIWTDKTIEEIAEKWQYGWIYPRNEAEKKINYVNAKTVNYIIKYISKRDEIHTTYKSIVLTSPGIGKNYTNSYNARNNRFQKEKTNETYRTNTGHKMAMPPYWRNKIYSEDERESLWLQRLDKQTMWVCGNKIDVSKGYETYDAVQKVYRQKNKQFGYGNEERTEEWYTRRAYENERRKLKQQERMNDPYGTKKKKEDRIKALQEYFGTVNITKQNE